MGSSLWWAQELEEASNLYKSVMINFFKSNLQLIALGGI